MSETLASGEGRSAELVQRPFEEQQESTEVEFLRLRCQELEQRISQISASNNISNVENVREMVENSERNSVDSFLNFKLSPNTFDGTGPLRDFLNQFNLTAKIGNWGESRKVAILISSLRGNARSVLEGMCDLENISFEVLYSKLKLRFGDGDSFQNHYVNFINRKQRFGEDFSVFGFELERLSRIAFPESSEEMRDKVACAQFINALSDNFIKRSLLTENISSLRFAIERAKVLKVINENCFDRNRNFGEGRTGLPTKFLSKNLNGKSFRNVHKENFQENVICWGCGGKGHFRSECSKNQKENQEN